jgi:hypothetical protein
VLGLVFASSPNESFQLPHGGQYEGLNRDAQLPNQFRCQTSKPSRAFSRTARPWAVEKPASRLACFQIGVSPMKEPSGVAAIWKQ